MGSALKVERFRPATLQETIAVSCEGRRHRSYRRRGDLPPIGGGTGIAFDKALGSINPGSTFNTTTAAAANSRVVVVWSFFENGALGTFTCTVGGAATTLDKQVTNGQDVLCIFSLALGAGGLASGSAITCTMTGGGLPGGQLVVACSYLGITGVDTTGSNTGTTAAAWTTGALTNANADSVYVAGAGTDGTMTTESSTPGVGTERFDLMDAADNQGVVMQDLIVSSIGSNAITGTWGTTTGLTTQTIGVVIYKGTASPAVPMTNKYARMRARRR